MKPIENKVMRKDGTVRSIVFSRRPKQDTFALAVKMVDGDRKVATSFAAGVDFRMAYKKAIDAVAEFNGITDPQLLQTMHDSIGAFMLRNNIELKVVLVPKEVLVVK